MDKLKYVKLENEDGSYSESIPLSVDSDYVNIDGTTLTSVMRKKTDVETTSYLQNQINNLVSGSPLVASSISEMVDTSRIYINTSNGYWYYYNNGSWIQGSVYQASEDSKTVSNLEKDTLNHDYALNMTLKVELGGFQGQIDIRNEDTRTERARTKFLDNVNKKGTVYLSNSTKWHFIIYRQNKITGAISSNGYIDEYTEDFSDEYYYRFLIKKKDSSVIDSTDILPSVYIYFEDNILELAKYKQGFNYERLSVGIFSGTDISIDMNNNSRLRSPVIIFNENGTLYSKVIDSNLTSALYSEKNGVVTNVSATDNMISIEAGVEYRFSFRGKNQDYDFNDYDTAFNKILYLKWYDESNSRLNILEEKTNNLFNYQQLIKSNANNILKQSYCNKFAFRDLDDGYISIGFDDGFYDVNDAIEYCHSKGVPCYYSLIPSMATGDVESMINNLLLYGGELCSHNNIVITPAIQADQNQMFNLFFNTKYTLENQFNTKIYGIIQAGGTGQNTEDKALDEKWARCAGYDYSDFYGENVPYHLGRRNLTRFTHEEQTIELERAKTNHEWQMWFCHHINGQEKNSYPSGYTLEDFKWFVDKALELNLNIVIPHYVISTFGTTELEKRIEALENNL